MLALSQTVTRVPIQTILLLQLVVISMRTFVFFLGGDDVQQLCEAGEAEFLEIMDLVGMASKPMHVRRLQKALQEWVQNPGEFLRMVYHL